MASESKPVVDRRLAIPRPVSAGSDPDGYKQFRAAAGYCLRAGRSQDSRARELRALLRSHSAARHVERAATRRIEIYRRAVIANTTRRSRVSKRVGGSTGNSSDQAKHHSHRSEYRSELQRTGEPAN